MEQQYLQGNYRLIQKRNLAKNIYDFTIEAKEMADIAQAGQFVHLRVAGSCSVGRSSICEIDRDAGALRLVFEVRGEGTAVLANLIEGQLVDVLGPLGKGFTLLSPDSQAVVVGGGIGTPPCWKRPNTMERMRRRSPGSAVPNAVILQEDFQRIGSSVMLCTDDGTMGAKGFVTQALRTRLMESHADIIMPAAHMLC